MRENVLVLDRRIAGIAQPGIGIGDRDPVMRIGEVAFLCPGRLGGAAG
jgi:hypothetical protein